MIYTHCISNISMRYRRLLFPIIFLCSLFLSCTTGFGMWLFNDNNTANLQYDPQDAPEDDKIQMDDIAENYYFAADLKSTNFYKVYFFPQPELANYKSMDYSTPMAYYEAQKSTFQNESYGYWGSRTLTDKSTSDFGNPVYKTDGTSDGTAYGYKTLTDIYKQLSPENYAEIGESFCTLRDSGWYGYFAGFTANPSTAINNITNRSGNTGTISVPTGGLLDLTKQLEEYDKLDGNDDNTVYFYAIYTNGFDSSRKYLPSVHIIKEGDPNAPASFQWMFLPSELDYSSNTNSTIPIYFSIYSIHVEETKPSTESLFTTYYLDQEYKIESKPLNNNSVHNWVTGDNQIIRPNSINLLKNKLTPGCYYNFHVYFNQRSNTANLSNNTIDDEIMKKNIIATEEITYSTGLTPSYGYMKFYIEKIYSPRLCGEISNSFNYDDSSTNSIPFIQTSTVTEDSKSYEVYETNEVSFASAFNAENEEIENRTFTFNYGESYVDSVLSLDNNAVYNNDTLNAPLKDINGNIVTNPTGGNVYYGTKDYTATDREIAKGNYNQIIKTNYTNGKYTTNDSGQKLPTITIAHPGVYKIRAKVHYFKGVPDEIKISVAYLKGLFIEIFAANPTGKIASSDFVSHDNYAYKAFFNYNSNPLAPGEEFFQDNAGNKYSLLTLLRDKYPDCNGFYDHVGGKNIRFDARRDNTTFTDSNGNPLKGQFTLDGGQTWIDEFPVTKNFIFYPVILS